MKKTIFKKTYSKIWWGVIQKFDLSPTETLLMFLVDGLSRQKGWCWASKSNLAKTLNISNQTIYSTISKLLSKNLLEHGEKSDYHKTALIGPTKEWSDLINKIGTDFDDFF